jgi:prepilin-type N-terminal cleavage/methylation domain-containing protein
MRLPYAKPDYGFTLIELMVTLTVLAIVMVAAVPSFVDFFDKYRLRGAVDDVVSVISNARAASVKADRDVNIAFGGTTTAWCVGANAAVEPTSGNPAAGATACDCTDTSKCLVDGQRFAVDVGRHVGIAVNSVATTFDYSSKLGLINPLGNAAATFTSPRGKYDMQVNINALGQANVCTPLGKPAIAGVPSC